MLILDISYMIYGLIYFRWDFIQKGDQIYKDMDRLVAFKEGLKTWSNWVESNIDPTKTRVFFQGISPTHYKYDFHFFLTYLHHITVQ